LSRRFTDLHGLSARAAGEPQHPPAKLPAGEDPLVVGTAEEQNAAVPAEAPPADPADDAALALWLVEPPVPPVDDVAVPTADDDPPDDCADCVVPPLPCGGEEDEESVCAGTSSGSVPQEEDVVTPPVSLGDTEHGPCGVNAGSAGAAPPEGVAPGESVPPDTELTEFPS
jgi:hypothetical protein